MKKRNQIPAEFKWDLSKFCKDDKEWYELLEQLKQKVHVFESYKGKLGDANELLKYFELSRETSEISDRLSMYGHNHLNTDLSNAKYTEMNNMLEGVYNELGIKTAFYSPEMLSYSTDYFDQLLKDDRFKTFAFGLKNLLRAKPHTLSEKEEKILSASTNFAGEFGKIFHSFCDVNLKFNPIKNAKGKELPLTLSKYSVYARSKDRILRKNAFDEFYKQFVSFNDTLANNYIASLKADWFYAQTSNYESVLHEALHPDNVSQKVYDNLINNVNKNLPLLHKYFSIKAKMLGLKDFSYHDMYVSSVDITKKVEFGECMNILNTALAVLGQDYVTLLNRSVKEKWMDIYPNEGKRSGAYQTDAYGFTPVVLLNYENLVEDVFTVAHELGHAMHSYHSNQAQPWNLAGYTIFLAEVASTVNEVLLLKYLYKNAKDKKEKIYYLEYYLQMFKSTLFRQTMFSEFEEFAHGLVEKNEAISKEVLAKYYGELNKRYHGKAVKHHSNIDYEWLRIPHFYGAYYVYKYATGITTAISLASKIINNEQGALQRYITFLSAGHTNYSVEILKDAGVNLETDEPYNTAFKEMEWAINELASLI